ncbi:MAG TPA: hypothetical protein VMU51_13520 [Mycobacteriales bacterium]|nr:hypothetical protein [Mycobacteriales bacterium]
MGGVADGGVVVDDLVGAEVGEVATDVVVEGLAVGLALVGGGEAEGWDGGEDDVDLGAVGALVVADAVGGRRYVDEIGEVGPFPLWWTP